MNRKKPGKIPASRRQSTSKPAQAPKQSFGALDPSQLGLAMPDWMTSSPPSPDIQTPADAQRVEKTTSLPEMEIADTPEAGPQARTVIEGMKVVCICKGIKKKVFWKALDDGMHTHDDINRATGSGSGSCQGRRCGPRILDMLRRLSP